MYNFSCSDGSDAYSFIISMIEELGESEAQKFFPIKAFDVDSFIIESAKSGKLETSYDDFAEISQNTNGNADKYFTQSFSEHSTDILYPIILKPASLIRDKVCFEVGDIRKQIDKIEPENSLLLCRNFWPYLGEKETEKTFKKIHERLDKGSLIVIGDYDCGKLYVMRGLAPFKFINRNIYEK